MCNAFVPGSYNYCRATAEDRRRACLMSRHDGPKMCRGAKHVCVCLVRGSKSCRGTAKHKCSCRHPEIENECLSAEHDCACEEKGPAFCLVDYGDHHCVCLKREPELCQIGWAWHQCICLEKGPSLCRSERHSCACRKFSWRACRLWGMHDDDRLAEARGVRALVVASYGSAPNAEIISNSDDNPVLSGFADLPHQLKLYVAEIPWVMAAAGTKDDDYY